MHIYPCRRHESKIRKANNLDHSGRKELAECIGHWHKANLLGKLQQHSLDLWSLHSAHLSILFQVGTVHFHKVYGIIHQYIWNQLYRLLLSTCPHISRCGIFRQQGIANCRSIIGWLGCIFLVGRYSLGYRALRHIDQDTIRCYKFQTPSIDCLRNSSLGLVCTGHWYTHILGDKFLWSGRSLAGNSIAHCSNITQSCNLHRHTY